MEVAVINQGYRNSGQAKVTAFCSRGHRAGIDNVVAQVGMGVDTGNHPVKSLNRPLTAR